MDKPRYKLILAYIAAAYVFIVIPGGLLFLGATGRLDLSLAANILTYASGIINSPAGEFVWE